jgi:3-dehydroquinate synthetase
MDMANFISVKLGLLAPEVRQRIELVLRRIWESVPLGDIDQHAYEEALKRDKKNRGTELGLILTAGFGQMFKHFVPHDPRFSEWLAEYFASRIRAGEELASR